MAAWNSGGAAAAASMGSTAAARKPGGTSRSSSVRGSAWDASRPARGSTARPGRPLEIGATFGKRARALDVYHHLVGVVFVSHSVSWRSPSMCKTRPNVSVS